MPSDGGSLTVPVETAPYVDRLLQDLLTLRTEPAGMGVGVEAV